MTKTNIITNTIDINTPAIEGCNLFLPTREQLLLFISEALIPENFEYGINDNIQVSLIVSQILRSNDKQNFMCKAKEVFTSMDEKHLALSYYTPQFYQKVLDINNETWSALVQSGTGLSILGNIALYQILHTANFSDETKKDIKTLAAKQDFYPSTGVINLDHLKYSN